MIAPGVQGKTVIEPTLADTLAVLKRDIFSTLHCVKVGEVRSFDPARRTVEVQLLFKRLLPDGTTVSRPLLVDVPVFTLQGGGGFLQFPIQAGDQCVVLFSDRNLDAWFETGSEAAPYDARCHDLSDGIALVGLNALTTNQPAYEAGKVKFAYGSSVITLDADGVQITNGSNTVAMDGDSLDLSSGAAHLTLEAGKIKVGGAQDLLALLNGLIDVLIAATVQGPTAFPFTAATITALTAYKVQLAAVLE